MDHAASPYNALTREDSDILMMCIESDAATNLIWQSEPEAVPAYAMA